MEKIQIKMNYSWSIALFVTLLLTSACSTEPQPINYGTDACAFCKMTIIDNRFGGEIVSTTGKPFKFDDAKCLAEFVSNQYIPIEKVKDIYLNDYVTSKFILISNETVVVYSETFKSPMGGNISAVTDPVAFLKASEGLNGKTLTWKEAKKILQDGSVSQRQ